MTQLRILEQEKAAQIKAQILRQKREIEEAREKAKAQDVKSAVKENGPPKNYKSLSKAEMSDELRMKTVFSEKLLRLLYSN